MQAGTMESLFLMERFTWQTQNLQVKWSLVCKPKRYSGLGISSLFHKNLALLAKWWWRYGIDEKALWKKLIVDKYGLGETSWVPSSSHITRTSSIWRNIVKLPSNKGVFNLIGFHACHWIVGNGASILFWRDKWLEDIPLSSKYPQLLSLATEKDLKVQKAWVTGEWTITFKRVLYHWEKSIYDEILNALSSITFIPSREDRLVWKHDLKRSFLDTLTGRQTPWLQSIWKMPMPPKVQCFLWMAALNSIPTKVVLSTRGVHFSPDQLHCSWCGIDEESCSHILLTYKFSWLV